MTTHDTRLALSLLIMLTVSGGTLTVAGLGWRVGVPAHLYPVEGPAASQTPASIYKLTLNMVSPVIVQLSATLPDGQVCRGSLETLARDDPSGRSMAADWDRVHGQGFFVAVLLGKDRAHATLTGDQGACLHIELFNPDLRPGAFAIAGFMPSDGNLENIEGVARDQQGNLFKLTFGGRT